MDDFSIQRVSLTVSDLDRSVEFYTHLLGFRLISRQGAQAVLGAGEAALLELTGVPGARTARGVTGLYHFALRLPTRQALAQLVYHLAQNDVPLQGFGDHGVSESVYLADPDGIGIEVYRDRPEAQWPRDSKGQLLMGTSEVDLDDLLKLVKPEEPFPGIPAGADIGHVHLHIADLEESIAFYRDIVGLALMQRYGPSAAFLAAGGYHHHFGINTWAGQGAPPPPSGAAGLRWVEFILPAEAIEPLSQRLERAGCDWVALEGSGLAFRDPSQNGLRAVPA